MAARAGGFPSCLDPDALAEFMRAAEVLTKDTIGEEGDRHMWSEYLLMVPGFVFLVEDEFNTRLCTALSGLGVSPKHQRKGVGQALVRWGLERAKEEGRDTFLIATGPGRKLYLGLGFQDVGEERKLLGEPHRCMIKRVEAAAR